MPLAHFTPEELPITLAILLAGVIIGFALGALAGRAEVIRSHRSNPDNE